MCPNRHGSSCASCRAGCTIVDQRGAAVMIMLLILVMGSAYFLVTQLNKGHSKQPLNITTTTDLGAITEALIGYALINNCLPCPSTTADDGAENCAIGRAGFLPWRVLGLGALDDWNHRIRYIVDPNFVTGCTLYQSSIGDMQVQTRDNTGTPIPIANGSNVPAVVISHGANGFGATNENGSIIAAPPASHIDERAHLNNATLGFMQRAATDDTAITGGPIDDLVGYIPLNVVISRVDTVTPGGLPASPPPPP